MFCVKYCNNKKSIHKTSSSQESVDPAADKQLEPQQHRNHSDQQDALHDGAPTHNLEANGSGRYVLRDRWSAGAVPAWKERAGAVTMSRVRAARLGQPSSRIATTSSSCRIDNIRSTPCGLSCLADDSIDPHTPPPHTDIQT